jgi:hypothetical protein
MRVSCSSRAGAGDLLCGEAIGVEPARPGQDKIRAELGDAVVVVVDHDVAQLRAPFRGQRRVLAEVVEDPDECRIDVRSRVAGHLAHPFAAVRSADPQGTVDPEGLRAEGAPVHQDVLAGVRSEALTEQHDPRPRPGRPAPQALDHAQQQQPVLFPGRADPGQ